MWKNFMPNRKEMINPRILYRSLKASIDETLSAHCLVSHYWKSIQKICHSFLGCTCESFLRRKSPYLAEINSTTLEWNSPTIRLKCNMDYSKLIDFMFDAIESSSKHKSTENFWFELPQITLHKEILNWKNL